LILNNSTKSYFRRSGGWIAKHEIVATKIPRVGMIIDDRRASKRLPIERDVRYKVLQGRRTIEVGSGRTLNMSSRGILFTTECPLPKGKHVELSVSWPARLHNEVALKLVVVGRLVRIEEKKAAITIVRYDFKTSRSKDLEWSWRTPPKPTKNNNAPDSEVRHSDRELID
jgi:hypothetical protein